MWTRPALRLAINVVGSVDRVSIAALDASLRCASDAA